MPRSRYALITYASTATVKVIDLVTSATKYSDTAGASSYSGDVAWSPNRTFSWLHSGTGSGDFQIRSIDCLIFDPSGTSWTPGATLDTLEDPPGTFHRWSSMCFHRSGDLFLANNLGTTVDRYATDGTLVTTYSPSVVAGETSEIHVVGDVIYYWAGNSGIRRYDIVAGQLADVVTGPITLVNSLDVDRGGRILLARGTAGVDLYSSAGTLVTSLNLGASSHHSASFDDDGRSVWIAYGRYVHNVRISDGVTIGTYDAGSGNTVDSIALLPGRRAGRGEWFARGEP